MNKIKNFFKKVGKGIKKVWIVCARFFKENVWAEVLAILAVIILFILALQGIVKGVEKCKNETSESDIQLRATTITSSQLMEKLNNNETFVLFLGANTCAHCKEFYKTVNTYVKSGNTVYYVDLADASDTALKQHQDEIEERLLNGVATDRNITSLATPTTVYVKDGEFADAIQGAYGMDGGTNYAIFCDVMEGKYVGKATYKLETE